LYEKQVFIGTVNRTRKTLENQTARIAIFREVFCTAILDEVALLTVVATMPCGYVNPANP
jgi:hypothetical protein